MYKAKVVVIAAFVEIHELLLLLYLLGAFQVGMHWSSERQNIVEITGAASCLPGRWSASLWENGAA